MKKLLYTIALITTLTSCTKDDNDNQEIIESISFFEANSGDWEGQHGGDNAGLMIGVTNYADTGDELGFIRIYLGYQSANVYCYTFTALNTFSFEYGVITNNSTTFETFDGENSTKFTVENGVMNIYQVFDGEVITGTFNKESFYICN